MNIAITVSIGKYMIALCEVLCIKEQPGTSFLAFATQCLILSLVSK